MIPQGNLVELSYHDLERDVCAELRRVYKKLGWSGFEEHMKMHAEDYVTTHADYQKNKLDALTPEVKKLVAQRWGRSFDIFHYTK